uniref:SEC7 domain-containing protein n=1 Tax=Grammatophora oceanica TaxID=210454 RepID=A0A7S1YBP5_9STRA
MWDGTTTADGVPTSSPKRVSSIMDDAAATPISSGHPNPPSTVSSVVHPALESKVLALELLLYVLQNTRMTSGFLQSAGPQLQYAVRNYLCVSLLKNCTSENTTVVSLSLRLFVPIIRNFRSHLKTEIEAFVTNVFFVILDSTHSSPEHKSLVVILFEEICSDPETLAEIFLNYDCDLSAVDLFHRIVNTLAKVARSGLHDDTKVSSMGFVAGAGAQHMEKLRTENRTLRLEAMRALRQILASLHGSITEPMKLRKKRQASKETPAENEEPDFGQTPAESPIKTKTTDELEDSAEITLETKGSGETKSSLVAMYDSKKKRRKEESEAALRFNRKPAAGIKYAAECGHIDASDPEDVARYLLKNKDVFEKTQIGEYLGREPEYQGGFSLKVLHAYVNEMEFEGLVFDDAIRLYLSNFRLPGEAQKIDRIMEKFAERFTTQNPSVFATADVAFILAFSIIMLNTDLHNPSIKEERRMTKEGFIRNNRGISDGQDLPEELLTSIFDRIQSNQISLKEDDDARAKESDVKKEAVSATIQKALNPTVFFSSHYDEMNKNREEQFQKEREQIVRTTESMLRRKGGKNAGRHAIKKSGHHRAKFVKTEDSGLRDEYVAPMFDVTWGPTLAAFSTAMESANGTMGALLSIATDAELESAAENAAETIETCLTGFRLAISTAGLCGNEVARDAFMLALSRFTQLGTGIMLEPRHVRCIQTLLQLGREDGELLGNTWEHVFKALSEVNRFHELFQLMARNDRVAAAAAERRRQRAEERQLKLEAREERRRLREVSSDDGSDVDSVMEDSTVQTEETFSDEDIFNDDDDFLFDDEMDKREIDEINARIVYDAVSEEYLEAIYQRSSTLSSPAIADFVFQLCRVSRMEISGYGGHVGSSANAIDMSSSRRQNGTNGEQAHPNQPNIFNLQKIVEVTHYNMDSRPRLVFAEIWATVAAHLTSTSLHSNAAVAMYAVDSFRQLSIQYLHREEGTGFEFQRKFLKPLETVMARCEHVDIRELLVNCVERIIFMFGRDDDEIAPKPTGRLRSGWRPVLTILGLAGRDEEESIAKHGFSLLTSQLRECLSFEEGKGGTKKPKAGVPLAERFVDIVDALLMYVSGPHTSMSLVSIDHLVTLSSFLADEDFSGPLLLKQRQGADQSDKGELRLWWPILLGLSRSIGDRRKEVRLKSLVTLLGVINQHFIPEEFVQGGDSTEAIQTLLLVFRGVLTPVLEHAEVDADAGPKPALPKDFVRFSTKQPNPLKPDDRETTWIETTFESFMDGCVTLCMRSIGVFRDDSLVEEIFAMLNTCLLSDSAVLAVRGLRRLQLFVSKDLGVSNISDDTWATFSHMLRRCLSVRGLPASLMRSNSINGSDSASSIDGEEHENPETEAEDIAEFVAEENILGDRRYIGSNVAATIRDVMSDTSLGETMGPRWRFFLMSGLGKAVKEWERAAEILASNQTRKSSELGPPDYVENAIYGRKLILKLCFQLMSDRDLMLANLMDDPPASSVSALKLVKEQTQSLLVIFIEKDGLVVAKEAQAWERTQLTQLKRLMNEMIALLKEQDRDVLGSMYTMTPMLSMCMQCSDERMHREMHSLIQIMMKEGPQTAVSPAPPTKKSMSSVTPPAPPSLAGTQASHAKRTEPESNGFAHGQTEEEVPKARPVVEESAKVADV